MEPTPTRGGVDHNHDSWAVVVIIIIIIIIITIMIMMMTRSGTAEQWSLATASVWRRLVRLPQVFNQDHPSHQDADYHFDVDHVTFILSLSIMRMRPKLKVAEEFKKCVANVKNWPQLTLGNRPLLTAVTYELFTRERIYGGRALFLKLLSSKRRSNSTSREHFFQIDLHYGCFLPPLIHLL